MTRRDQICRAWISRATPAEPWKSHVSIAGTRHTLSTGTRHRRSAREFCLLHLRSVLNHTPSPTPSAPHHPELL